MFLQWTRTIRDDYLEVPQKRLLYKTLQNSKCHGVPFYEKCSCRLATLQEMESVTVTFRVVLWRACNFNKKDSMIRVFRGIKHLPGTLQKDKSFFSWELHSFSEQLLWKNTWVNTSEWIIRFSKQTNLLEIPQQISHEICFGVNYMWFKFDVF